MSDANDAAISKLTWNPRYAVYAKAHGKTSDAMMEHDRDAWPGGCMCGFILWMSEQETAFWKACPSAFLNQHTIRDQDAWTAFLQSVANASLSSREKHEK